VEDVSQHAQQENGSKVMPDKEDYRNYLEEKFKGLQSAQHGYFNEVHDKLDAIEKQTMKTNNRVTKIEDDLVEYRMIKKYPKIAVLIITITVLATIFGFMKIVNREVSTAVEGSTETLRTEIRHMDKVSKTTRDGYVKYNDFGLTDSIKIR